LNFSTRDYLHLGLLLPMLAGFGVVFYFFAKSVDYPLPETSFTSSAQKVWSDIFEAIPAPMPGEFPDEDYLNDIESVDDVSPTDAQTLAGNNAFLVTCTLLVLLGCFGLALLSSATRIGEPWWNSFIRSGTMIAAAFVTFSLWGFYLAFPGDHFGIFPRFSFTFPGYVDPIEYGLSGVSEWTDVIYIASYAAFIGCLLVSFSSAAQTTASSFLISLPVLSIAFPLVLSWKWGAGWIDQLLNNADFAGAALVHWHVGACALLIGGVLTFFRTRNQLTPLPTPEPMRYLAGGALYFLGVIGLNAGSTLTAAPGIVASVIQCTAVSAAASGVVASIFGAATRQGHFVTFLVAGVIGGAVAVSGGADTFTMNQSLVIGTFSGAVIATTLFFLQQLKWADPLAVGVTHGLGGFIGIFATCLAASEDGINATFGGQLVLLVTVPLMSLFITAIVLMIAGATGFLTYEKKPTPVPPSLPRTS